MKTPQEFYDYFYPIPQEEWAMGDVTSFVENRECHCAIGHLGAAKFGYEANPEFIRKGFTQNEVVENIENLALIFGAEAGELDHYSFQPWVYNVNDASSSPEIACNKKLQGKKAKENILNKLIEEGAEP